MGRFSLGTLQAVTLVAGGILTGALGYAGVAILSARAGDGDAAATADRSGIAGQTAAASGSPASDAAVRAGEGETEPSGPLAGLQNRLGNEYDSKVYIYKTHIADSAADSVLNPVDDALSPGFDAGVQAVEGSLPPFLSGHVPWLANYAKFVAVNSAGDTLGNAIEDQVQDAADTARPGFLGGGQAAPADGAATSAAAPATASSIPAASASAAGSSAPTAAVAGLPAAQPAEIYFIRMGRFATVANAERFASDLTRRGVPARVEILKESGRLWSIVRHGRFAGRGAAEVALRDLSARGFGGSVISDTAWGGAS